MEEQGIWFNLLCLAGESRMPGIIQASPDIAYPISFVAAQLRISKKLLEKTLVKFEEQERITNDVDGIHIVNWYKYQSDYNRQKKYRKPKETEEIPF